MQPVLAHRTAKPVKIANTVSIVLRMAAVAESASKILLEKIKKSAFESRDTFVSGIRNVPILK